MIGWPRWSGEVTSEQRPESRELARPACGGRAFGKKIQQVGGYRGRYMLGQLRQHQGNSYSKVLLLGKESQLRLLPSSHPYISSLSKSCELSSKTFLELIHILFAHDYSNLSPCHFSFPELLQEPSNLPSINSCHTAPLLKIPQEFPIAL